MQLSLLTDAIRIERPRKRQRTTARQVYREQRSIDVIKRARGEETREGQILRLLSWHWTVTQRSPTALELLDWALSKGEQLFDANSVRPRLTALMRVGLIEPRTKRRCQVSGKTVWTWAVREIGSKEPR